MTNDANLEQFQEIIDKLHSGIKLNDQEKSIVENNTDFQDYQKEFSLIEKAITHSALGNKLSTMKKFEEKYEQENPKKKTLGRRSYLLFAAACILLLLSFFLFNTGDDSYDGDLLAGDFVIDFTDPDATRSNNDKKPDDAYELFNDGQYYNASKAFDNLLSSDNNPKHKFFNGICLLRLSKWKDAESLFSDQQVQGLKNYPINYYLAVSKIGLEKTDEAIELLKTPSSGHAVFNQEAEKIIKKLEKIRNRKNNK